MLAFDYMSFSSYDRTSTKTLDHVVFAADVALKNVLVGSSPCFFRFLLGRRGEGSVHVSYASDDWVAPYMPFMDWSSIATDMFEVDLFL